MKEREILIDELISESRSYLGVPWVHQGRSRKGVDCVGFLLLTLKKYNINITEIKGYARSPDGVLLKKTMDEQENLISISMHMPIKVGDIVLFKIRKEPQHIGLITPSNTAEFGMIHAFNGGQKKVVEHDFADYWRKRIVAVYRLK